MVQTRPTPDFLSGYIFAIAYVMMYSGYSPDPGKWQLANPDFNMISV